MLKVNVPQPNIYGDLRPVSAHLEYYGVDAFPNKPRRIAYAGDLSAVDAGQIRDTFNKVSSPGNASAGNSATSPVRTSTKRNLILLAASHIAQPYPVVVWLPTGRRSR